MRTPKVKLELTPLEADQLWLGYNAGTVDDGIESLAWTPAEKAAARRAEEKLLAARRRAHAVQPST